MERQRLVYLGGPKKGKKSIFLGICPEYGVDLQALRV